MKRLFTRPALTIGTALLVAAILLVTLGPWTRGPGASSEKKFDVGAARTSVVVRPDTTLRITERLHFRFSGDPFTGAYRDIAVADGTTLSGVRVSDGPIGDYVPGGNTLLGSDGDPGTYGTESIPGGERVVWHYADQDGGSRDFTLRYTAIGAADAYDDVVRVRWSIWGDQWKFALPKLTAELTLPDPAAGSGKPLRVWLEPGRLDTAPRVTATGATVGVDRVPQGTQVVLSAMYPRAAFSNVDRAALHVGPGRAELDRLADAAAPGFLDRAADWLWVNALLASIVIGVLIAAVFALELRRTREHPAAAPEYLPAPPSNAIPAVGHGLATEGVYSQRVVLATLLDLADRGYYTQEAGEGKKKLGRLDLVLGIAPDRPAEKLTAAERKVLSFFDELIGDEPGGLSTLKDRIPKHSETWRRRWEAMNKALEDAGEAKLAWDLDRTLVRWALLVAALVLFGIVLAAGVVRAEDGYIPAVGLVLTAGLLLAPRGQALKRLAPAVREESAAWQAFSRWTHDFPTLSDDAPATLALWKRILVFGVAFGTAKRVIESGRIPESIMRSPEFVAGTGAYAFMGDGDYASGFGSGFSSQVAAQSSSGAGGGGGGGSSGGGGGGAW